MQSSQKNIAILKRSRSAVPLVCWLCLIATLSVMLGCDMRTRFVNPSMEPMIQAGDEVVYDPDAYGSTADVERWDVVVHGTPANVSPIRRVWGLPGETITFDGGKVYSDGVELIPPPEIDWVLPIESSSERIPVSGSLHLSSTGVFVLADRSKDGADFRIYGEIDFNDIAGKVVKVIPGQAVR